MKKLITIFTLYFSSCVMDSINITKLVNHTGDDISVSIYYNKALLDSLKIRSYAAFLKQKTEGAKSFVVSVDTNKAVVTYKVPKDGYFDIDRGSGSEPDFTSMESIVIQSSRQSSIKYSRNEILQAAKPTGKGFWEWEVN